MKRTPADFEFAVKMYQKFTHPGMAVDPGPISRPTSTRSRAASIRSPPPESWVRCSSSFQRSFQRTPEAVGYVAWLLQTFAGYPLAVELRHRSWSDAPDTGPLLAEHRAAWVQIDEPKFPSSIRQDLTGGLPRAESRGGSELYYLRLHGRNAAQWWDHAESEDRYNYFYSPAELEPIAQDGARRALDDQRRLTCS